MDDDILKSKATDMLPQEPEPVPVVPPPFAPEPPAATVPTLDPVTTPAPAVPDALNTTPAEDSIMESLLETKSTDAMVVPPVQSSSHHGSSLPKKTSKGPLIALIALLLLVLPTSVYFISLKNQQIADVRSKAWGPVIRNARGHPMETPEAPVPRDMYVTVRMVPHVRKHAANYREKLKNRVNDKEEIGAVMSMVTE